MPDGQNQASAESESLLKMRRDLRAGRTFRQENVWELEFKNKVSVIASPFATLGLAMTGRRQHDSHSSNRNAMGR